MLFYENSEIRFCVSSSSMLSSVSARAIIAAAVAIGLPSGAAYADDCGAPPTATCSGPYPSGITYTGVDALTLSLPGGVSVTGGVTITTAAAATGDVKVDIDTGAGVVASATGSDPDVDHFPGALRIEAGAGASGDLSVSMKSGVVQNNGDYTAGLILTTSDPTTSSDMQVDFSGGSIVVSGNAAGGLTINNTGTGSSVVNMTGGTITANASPGATGLGGVQNTTFFNTPAQAQNIVNLSGGTITMNADESNAVIAIAVGLNDAVINLSGTTVLSTGQGAATDSQQFRNGSSTVIVEADGGGDAQIWMTDGSVASEGDYSPALHSRAQGNDSSTANALVSVEGGTVSTKGSTAPAVYAYNITSGAANASIKGGVISTEGDNSDAVYALGRRYGEVSVNMAGGTVTTTGKDASGLVAEINTVLDLSDAKVYATAGSVTTGSSSDPTKGSGSHGLYATSMSPTGQAYAFAAGQTAPLTITTYGANAYGIFAEAANTGTAYAGMQGGTISTAGDGSYGIAATTTKGDVEADYFWGDIATAGDGAHGVYAQAGGAGKVSMILQNYPDQGQQLSTTGDGAHGAYATSLGGAIDLFIQGNIITKGAGSYGVDAEILGTGASSDITAAVGKADISTQGAASHGIYLKNHGKGNVVAAFSGEEVNGSSISTATDGSYAVYLESSNDGSAQFTGDVTKIDTSGSGAHAIYVTNQDTGAAGNASISYQSGHITTTGSGAYGLYAEALGSGTADVTTSSNGFASTINVSGADAFGVSAYSQGAATTVSLDDATITATGNAEAAVGFAERWSAGQAATQATITFGGNLIIDASGSAGQHAFYNADDQAGTNMNLTTTGTVTGSAMMGGGNSSFTLAGGSFTGNIYGDFDPSETPAINQGSDAFIWSGGTLNSGFYGQGGNDTALIEVPGSANFAAAILDGGEDGGAPESRISSDIDEITFAASNDSVAGRNITNWEKFTVNENLAIKFIDDGMTLDGYDGGNANDMGDLYMLAGSSVMGGTRTGQSFTLNGNLSNQGVLSMQDGAYGGNFIVEGDYTSNGGELALDVDFGDLKADVLTVGKDLGGVTQLEIADIGTTGNPGAVLIVDTTTGTHIDQNEFKLDKNDMTASGIYAYGLTYSLEGDPANGYPPGVYLSAVGNPTPSPPGPPVPPQPRLQPFVPLYEGYQSALLDMNKLPTMRQRVGKRAWLGAETPAPVSPPILTPKDPGYYSQPGASVDSAGTPEISQNGSQTTVLIPLQQAVPALENVWGRMSGDFSHLDPSSSTTGYKYDLSTFEVQAGVDGLFYDDGPGSLVAGLTVHYRTGEAKFDSVYGDSKVHPDGYGFGGTLTWYGENGFYTDGQAQATWYSSELKADDLYNGVENSDAFGYALSVEAGQQFLLDSNDLILTPQAQLAWSSVAIDSFTGAYNDDASFDNGDSLQARLGLAVEKEFISTDANGLARRGNIYGIANIYHEFMGETKAVIEQTFVASSALDDWTGEIGIGGTYDWTDANNANYGVYGEVTAATGLSGGSYSYGGNLGFRVKW
ncbi:autotransporter outer membrane beta-barrel domain-containing protein [Martelella soudanensis]|uniref:autotransporter outer membrane beta-barrel domain-containing protein n=1 Tax=unclassified Martelella TaxID=2629616 RepID=UPI0015DFC67A|nr:MULTISPECIES: autotransporter outer membrane beta-barrel domain-containing protein [unclassified Martelella]